MSNSNVLGRLLTDANRRNSAENLAGISPGDAKRARQIARLEQQSHSRWDTRWPASTRIDSFSPGKLVRCAICDMKNWFNRSAHPPRQREAFDRTPLH
jgi:hypothetical protein